jgi:2-polyprenyl-6-methoxyphenol hydroxylase-like FAD-dependent oxidoreductase
MSTSMVRACGVAASFMEPPPVGLPRRGPYSIGRSESVAACFGLPSLAVHRADLRSVLLAGVRHHDPHAVHAAHEFVALEQDADGVTVRFAHGATVRGGVVVVGADGSGSAVRSFVFPGDSARGNKVARWSMEEGRALQGPTIANKGAAGYGLLDDNRALVPVCARLTAGHTP